VDAAFLEDRIASFFGVAVCVESKNVVGYADGL